MVMNTPTFFFDGENRALDLLNTVVVDDGAVRDLLAHPHAVGAWLVASGTAEGEAVCDVVAFPPLGRRLVVETVQLRDALRVLVDAFARGTVLPPQAVFALDRVLEARRRHTRVRADGVSLSVEEAVDDDVPLGLLEPVARAALELVTQGDRARLRQCDADDCGLWFYDTSRNGSRRWCSMARCGNRAKVAAHYRRHRED